MVGACGAVDAHCAAKFGHHHDGGVLPPLLQALLEGAEGCVKGGEALRELPCRTALARVRVPAVERQSADARTIVGGKKARSALGDLAHAHGVRWPVARAHRVHAARCSNTRGLNAIGECLGQRRIALRVEVHEALREIIIGARQDGWRPAEDRRWSPRDKRRNAPDPQDAGVGETRRDGLASRNRARRSG